MAGGRDRWERRAAQRFGDSVVLLLLHRPQGTAVGDRATRFGLHVERQRLVAGRTDLNPMRSGFEARILRGSVEVVYRAHVETVNEDLGCRRLDSQTKVASP